MKLEAGKAVMNNLKQKAILHLNGIRKTLNISSRTKKTLLPPIAQSAVNTIRFVKNDGSRLIIDSSVIYKLLQYQQKNSNDYEAGGLLLGRHLNNGSHLAVDHISTPQWGDKRSRYGFFRGKGHQRIAHKHWAIQDGTCTYLGNWHTHPESRPTPSQTDFNDWLNVLKNDVYESDYLYFVIVGTHEIACWEGTKNKQSFIKLTEYKYVG